MRTFIMQIRINFNRKKIQAVKDTRDCFDLGLVAAKDLVEELAYPGTTAKLKVTDAQLGRFSALLYRQRDDNDPIYHIVTVEPYVDPNIRFDCTQ